MKFKRALLLIFILLFVGSTGFLTGCSTTRGKYFDMEKTSQIKEGISTKKDVLSLFGKPSSKSKNGAYENWNYSYMKAKYVGFLTKKSNSQYVDKKIKMLFVTFNGDIVQSYGTHETGQ